MNYIINLFHLLCFSEKELPWYFKFLKYFLYYVILCYQWGMKNLKEHRSESR
jgi:hypothetical protein